MRSKAEMYGALEKDDLPEELKETVEIMVLDRGRDPLDVRAIFANLAHGRMWKWHAFAYAKDIYQLVKKKSKPVSESVSDIPTEG